MSVYAPIDNAEHARKIKSKFKLITKPLINYILAFKICLYKQDNETTLKLNFELFLYVCSKNLIFF